MNVYPQVLYYKNLIFHKKECMECSATFWHVNDDTKYCGSNSCNTYQMKDIVKKNISLYQLIKEYNEHFLNYNNPLFKKVHIMSRPKMNVKHSTTDMHFLCAGVAAYESLIDPKNVKLKYFTRDLFVSNVFCYRFLDKTNVGSTKRHSTGFFMAGLHCFEGEDKFPKNWKELAVELVLSYFIEVLKFSPSSLYLHADSWSVGKKGGPSVEIYGSGVELGNCVFTERDLYLNQDLDNRYLDVGLGIERIHDLICAEENVYFNNFLYDHLRTIVVGFKDKLYPSKIGVGYNLRKLCEQILKVYQYDLPLLKEDLKNVYNDLAKVLLDEDFLDEEEINRTYNLIKDELNRCVSSHIL